MNKINQGVSSKTIRKKVSMATLKASLERWPQAGDRMVRRGQHCGGRRTQLPLRKQEELEW
jgi:hypothetical protein